MGVRSPVARMRAVAVAIVLASQLVVAPLVAEIRVPLPGTDKANVVQKKRSFRPTLPARNPDRITARITAVVTPSTDAKTDLEAASFAGATSSASTAVQATIVKAPTPETPGAPEVVAALPRDDAASDDATADDDGAEPAETANDAASKDDDQPAAEESQPDDAASAPESPAEEEEQSAEAVTEDEQPIETAAEDTPPAKPDEATPDETTPVVDSDEDETTAEPGVADVAEAAAEEPAEAEQASEATEDSSENGKAQSAAADEAAPEESESTAAAPTEAEEPAEPADTSVETPDGTDESDDATEEASTVTAAAAPDEEAPAEPEDAEQVSKPETPSHDATVVLEVAPPPEDVVSASKAEEADEADKVDDAKPMEMAAATPPSVPAPASAVPNVEEKPDAGAPGSTPGDADEAEAEPAAEADETEGAEQAAEPPKPPAHPTIATVRAQLAEPDLAKTVAASDLEALQSFYGDHQGPPLWVTSEGFTPKAQALIEKIEKADDWGLDSTSFELPPAADLLATPNAQADDELQLSIAVLKYARHAQGGRRSPSLYSPLFDQRPPIRNPKDVLTEIAAAAEPEAYLTSLHPQHEQFKRLRKALLNARGRAEASGQKPETERDVQLITMNMERWRWLPRSLGNYYVWNNVPEFNVRVMKGGKTIYQEKTVVGQYKYATPFFSAPMRNIVFHPNWTVPPTIVKEDLAPKLQGSGGGGFFGNSKKNMLRRYGLSVSYKGKPIDADSVDWNNVNVHAYTFTQDPGPANVLGKFKFNFPNRHAIYMHDTVQPELFGESIRTLSHGCIRVNQPDRLATLLLAQDKGWSAAQVRNLVVQNESKAIAFNRSVPVHLTYFTATVDENGTLNRFGDIYSIDNRMAQKLFKRPATFPVPAEPVIADAPQNTRARRSGGGGGGFDDLISGLFGN